MIAAKRLAHLPEGVMVEKASASPSYAEWIRPKGADEKKAILYFHGDGFVMGNVNSQRGIVGGFVKQVGYNALLFDYRLAPEFPSPAAVFDSTAIYCWMLEQGYKPEDIIFVGDSAGGGIELDTLIKLRDDGMPLPAACVAFSPSLDMTYPYTSPLYGDLTGLPPIMIHVCDEEMHRDGATLFGENADSYHVDVRIKVWKGMFHCFPLLTPRFKEATEAIQQVKAFVRQHMYKEDRIAAAFLHMMILHRL